MPLHALQNFVTAARLGNLIRAAESLNLTVSALSHQMRQLEQRLGYPLLRRQPRGVGVTPEGQRLLEQVGPHLDAIQQVFQPFGARHDRVLTVSALPSMTSNWLVPRLGSFVAAHPEIEFNLESSERLTDFDRNVQCDAALRVGAGQWAGVHAEPLFDEWLMPMASPVLVSAWGAWTRARSRNGRCWGIPMANGSAGSPWRAWTRRVATWRCSTSRSHTIARRWTASGWRWGG